MAYPAPDPFRTAIRNGLAITYIVDASLGGVPVEGATDLRPTGGTITDTTRPGVRRLLNLELVGGTDLYDALTPFGTTLTVTARVRYTNRATVDIPMGVFDVDRQEMSHGSGSVSLTAPDKWGRIQRARLIKPVASVKGRSVAEEITALIRGALGSSEPVTVTATGDAIVGTLTYEKDRAQAIISLATSIGAWVFFDRDGVATIADVPQIGMSADWLVDASASGVLISLDRERSRESTRNVVVVESSAADGAKFATQYVWDADPASPTYAGTDPVADPGSAGPFGIVPYFHDSPVLTTVTQARRAGQTILARTTGLASSVSLSQVPNPAVDAFDVLDVLPPGRAPSGVTWTAGEGFGTGPFGEMSFGGGTAGGRPIVSYASTETLQRHLVDTVTHPLTVGPAQQIQGRSTRSDVYVDGG